MKHLNLLLCVFLFISLTMQAQVWDGTSKKAFTGEGTAENPYLIESPEQLAYLAEQVNSGNNYEGKYFLQTVNLDLGSKEWSPIGTRGSAGGQDDSFNGNYDGGNKTISNLSMKTNSFGGLFGVIDNATIKHLGIESGKIEATRVCGGIAGGGKESTIEYCYNKAEIITGNSYCGGILGAGGTTCIVNCCYNIGKVTGNYAAGIAYNCDEIKNCYNVGQIVGQTDSGGICVGANAVSNCYNASSLSNVENVGNIFSTKFFSGTLSNNYYDKDLNKYKGGAIEDESGKMQGISTTDMKSGEIWSGYDADIWEFKAGSYPTLKVKETSTANEQIKTKSGLKVYGSNLQITIQMEEPASATIYLSNMLGQILGKQSVNGNEVIMNVPSKGNYIVTVITTDRKESRKISL
ncbi:T9SS type A sorting domain-containing protein [uncultured Parabacteroides sp.]|uniref:T9SS type A sorting domain-containing protein n=1 Tax=uncultured Parabacteroides sp. TaxID=512312 RepID=UPI0025948E1E|nr:T9SS type A sorting domain-containing protein [uncultured Parabacteroides sp.]